MLRRHSAATGLSLLGRLLRQQYQRKNEKIDANDIDQMATAQMNDDGFGMCSASCLKNLTVIITEFGCGHRRRTKMNNAQIS